MSLASVVQRTGLSHGYLEQLAQSLRRAGLIRGRCGKQGGYQLLRLPQDISVRAIIEAVIGPINIVECVEETGSCLSSEYCECRPMYRLMNRAVTEALDRFSLQDMVTPGWIENIEKRLQVPAGTSVQTGSGCPSHRPTG